MEAGGQLSATQSKAVLGALLERGGGDPAALAKEMGFEAMAAGHAWRPSSTRSSPPTPTSGRASSAASDKLKGFFTGKVMKATSGKANGKEVAAELAPPPGLGRRVGGR